jgi:RHS repeat-associated protein
MQRGDEPEKQPIAARPEALAWSVRDEGAKVLREFTSMETSNPFGLTGHTWTKDYVWRDGLLLASIAIPAGLSTPTTYDYHLDHFGTPTMITTDNGMVVSNHTYYPFGSEMSQPQENPAEAMKFTGHERDIAAGDNHSVDYMHARFYNPNLGRFLELDRGHPHPTQPQSWLRYSYARNNPASYFDPDGRDVYVRADLEPAAQYGIMYSPTFHAQFDQQQTDHRIKVVLLSEFTAESGTRAHSVQAPLVTDCNGVVVSAGETVFIPLSFISIADQAARIAHEMNHLSEDIAKGLNIEERAELHDPAIRPNPSAGPYHWESSTVQDFERIVQRELREHGDSMLPEKLNPLVRNMADLTPGPDTQ